MSVLFGQNEFDNVSILSETRSYKLFAATRKSNNEEVILKILDDSISNELAEKYLLKEIVILQKLQNENLFPVPKLVNLNGNSYSEFPNFKGKSIDHLIKSKSITLADFYNISKQLVLLLIEIHDKGILHTNLSPSAIIYDEKSNLARVTDFCISKFTDTEYQWNEQIEMWQSNLNYLSPEQQAE